MTTDTRTTTRPDPTAPRTVQIAAGWMGVQCFLGVLALVFLILIAGQAGPMPGALIALLGVTFAFYVLIGILASLLSTGRRWVRITALTLEILMIGQGLWSLFTSPNLGTVLALVIAAVITCYLFAHDTAEWFTS